MKQLLLCLTCILLIFASCFSQVTLKGSLKDTAGNPIPNSNIVISEIDTDNIIGYDISDENGYFSITIETLHNKVDLNITSMGFKSVNNIIENKPQNLRFILNEQITQLKEVILKNNPIARKGDTINYSVNAFSKQEDRTIADVLKNMPGIEVLPDGKILYQGKPINKYYIEGLDLLEGKYNLANSNLPYKDVIKVQVLENHQPVKILDSLVYSDQTAINIKLKNEYTFTGQAKLGSGFSPLLWNTNLTPMLFSKKQQMLSSYQANNTGDNVAAQLKTLTIQDLLEQFELNDDKKDWLAIQKLATPNFSEQRWLDNNIHLVTVNDLHKLKNDYELRLNLSYINDYQQQNGFTKTQFYTANDTIALFENKYNQLYTNTLETNLTLQKNTNKTFFKNSMEFQGFWDGQQGSIELNNANIHQDLNNHYFKLSNKLKTLFPLGKKIATLNSYIGFNKTPQSLVVNPGQFEDLLNNGIPYNELFQNIDLQTFYTNNSLGFTKGWKSLSFSPKLGLQLENQNLKSRIMTSTNQNLSNSFNNDLDWTRSKFYVRLDTQYKKDKWRMELTTSLNLHNYNIEDSNLQMEQGLMRLTFEPRLSVNYDLTSFWRIAALVSLSNQFGSIDQTYYSYILKSYRNIQRINTQLPEIKNMSYSASIRYRNPIKSLFFSLNFNNSTKQNNLLYDIQILNNGATELQAIQKNNIQSNYNLSTTISKYFSDFNTNLTVGVNFSIRDYQQIINTETVNVANQNYQLSPKLDTDIFEWLNIELESIWQFSYNKIQNQNNQIINQEFHKFNVNIYPTENHYFSITSEHIKNDLFSETNKNFFADLEYRYTWKKKKIDFEIHWNNIFNTDEYRTINTDNFSYVETNFNLRPSQILLKVRFSL